MPQVWGLTLAAALVSWLMRPEMHESPVKIADLTVVTILTAALFVVYVELGSSVLVSYGIYVALLAWRRRISLRLQALLWTKSGSMRSSRSTPTCRMNFATSMLSRALVSRAPPMD